MGLTRNREKKFLHKDVGTKNYMCERDFWFWLQGFLDFNDRIWYSQDNAIGHHKQLILKKLRQVREPFSRRMRYVKDFCLDNLDIDLKSLCEDQLYSFMKWGCGR